MRMFPTRRRARTTKKKDTQPLNSKINSFKFLCVFPRSHLIAITREREREIRNNNVVPLSPIAAWDALCGGFLCVLALSSFYWMSHNKTLKGMKYFSMISFYAIIRCEPLQSLSFKHAFRQRSWAGLVFCLLSPRRFLLHVCIILWGLKFPRQTRRLLPYTQQQPTYNAPSQTR